MKQLTALLLTLCLVLGMTACGKTPEEKWQEQYDLGVRYLSDGDYENAIIAFEAAIKIDAKKIDSYLGRAQAYLKTTETSAVLLAAENDYLAVLDADETNVQAWLGLADLAIRRADYRKALEVLTQALEKTGGNEQIRQKLEELENGDILASDGLIRMRCSVEEMLIHDELFYLKEIAKSTLPGDEPSKLILSLCYDAQGGLCFTQELTYFESGINANDRKSLTVYDQNNVEIERVEYQYDEQGREIYGSWSYTCPSGLVDTVTSEYDAEGRLHRETKHTPLFSDTAPYELLYYVDYTHVHHYADGAETPYQTDVYYDDEFQYSINY